MDYLERIGIMLIPEVTVDNLIFAFVFLIQIVILTLIIMRYISIKIRERGRERYWSDTPDDIPPTALAFMLSEKPKGADLLAAEIANFISKGILSTINYNGILQMQITREPNERDNLWDYQYAVFRRIIATAADRNGIITVESFKNNRNQIVGLTWIGIILQAQKELESKGYKKEKTPKELRVRLVTIEAFLMIIGMLRVFVGDRTLLSNGYVIVIPILFIIINILAVKNMKADLSNKGKKSYKQWISFRAFLRHYSKFKDRGTRDVILWRKFLVYGCAFGLSDKLTDEVEDVMTKEIVKSLVASLTGIGLGIAKKTIKSELGLNRRT